MKLKKRITLIMTIAILTILPINKAYAVDTGLSETRQRNADLIANLCIANWDYYGCLPSVACAQAMVETGLGSAYNNGNLWGICCGRVSYPSIQDGAIAYMKVINNGYYKGAPFCTDYHTQMRRILDGGYCQPEGNYYPDAIYIIEKYKFYEYDKLLFDTLQKREEEKQRKIKEEKIRKQKEEKQRKLENEFSNKVKDIVYDVNGEYTIYHHKFNIDLKYFDYNNIMNMDELRKFNLYKAEYDYELQNAIDKYKSKITKNNMDEVIDEVLSEFEIRNNLLF